MASVQEETPEATETQEGYSAYDKAGYSLEILQEMSLEALAESQASKHTKLEVKFSNESDTPANLFMNGKLALSNPGEKMTVAGIGIDLVLPRMMQHIDAKIMYEYFFTPTNLVEIVERFTEYDQYFPDPKDQKK